MKKLWVWGIVTILLVIACTNIVYYLTTKATLIESQREKIRLNVNSVKTAIEATKEADDYFNNMLSEKLRISAVAVNHALPSDYRKVSNEQLEKLSDNLGLDGITLYAKSGTEIVAVRSSLSIDMGHSTKEFEDKRWYQVFNNLLTNHQAPELPEFGESKEHFWTAPFETDITNPHSVKKSGYYNDGKTNYLINTYISNSVAKDFNSKAGVGKAIERILDQNSDMLEIAVVNSQAVLHGEKKQGEENVVWYTDKLLVYGKNNYRSLLDPQLVREALQADKDVYSLTKIGKKQVIKTYMPIPYTNGEKAVNKLFVIITTDYDEVQSELFQSTVKILIISLICTMMATIILLLVVRSLQSKEFMIHNFQEMYLKQINSLFTTVKEYKHDFTHHLYTIQGLLKLKKHDELEKYIAQISNIHTNLNDIINVNLPALSGLLQAKVAEAEEKGIKFEHHFEGFHRLQWDMEKATNLIRVIGNILDNAYHAVLEKPDLPKKVVITGKCIANRVVFRIHNNGKQISPALLEQIFKEGFTTRRNRGGSGIGLASSRKIVEGYKGNITVESDESWTSFTVILPASSKEISSEGRTSSREGDMNAS